MPARGVDKPKDEIIPVRLERLLLDSRSQSWVVILVSAQETVLPITVGLPEGTAIEFAISKSKPPRPLTHDLTKSFVHALRGRIEKVVIDDLKANTYFAKIHLVDHAGVRTVIDSRPSDAIALAVRVAAPLYASRTLLEKVERQEILSEQLSKEERERDTLGEA